MAGERLNGWLNGWLKPFCASHRGLTAPAHAGAREGMAQ